MTQPPRSALDLCTVFIYCPGEAHTVQYLSEHIGAGGCSNKRNFRIRETILQTDQISQGVV